MNTAVVIPAWARSSKSKVRLREARAHLDTVTILPTKKRASSPQPSPPRVEEREKLGRRRVPPPLNVAVSRLAPKTIGETLTVDFAHFVDG